MREVHNIAIFGHKRIPSREGGVEIVVEELGTRLVQKGYHVTCFNEEDIMSVVHSSIKKQYMSIKESISVTFLP